MDLNKYINPKENSSHEYQPTSLRDIINSPVDGLALAQSTTLNRQALDKNNPVTRYMGDSNFGRLNYSSFANNEAIYDTNQSAGTWWGNTLGRFGARTANVFGHGMSFSDDFKNMSTALDGDESSMTSFERYLQDRFPTYESDFTKVGFAGYFSKGAHTKWSQTIDQLGFSAGVMGSAIVQDALLNLATGGIGLLKAPLTVARTYKTLSAFRKIALNFEKFTHIHSQ
jgi:hypothetical protein